MAAHMFSKRTQGTEGELKAELKSKQGFRL